MADVFDRMPAPERNFVSDFQTKGFDARVWELYLFAALLFTGYEVTQPNQQPDFFLRRLGETAWLEAVTANPPQTATAEVNVPVQRVLDDILPIRYGTPLRRKVEARYWTLPHVAKKALVIAIADFGDSEPLRWTSSPIHRYLYGVDVRLTSPIGAKVDADVLNVHRHVFGNKEIPSNFFSSPDSEHISAVLFCNSGTVMKFNRMGFHVDRYPALRMVRQGFRHDPDPAAFMPRGFAHMVGDVSEDWLDGAVVFHNPAAVLRLSSSFFYECIQYRDPMSVLAGLHGDFVPVTSQTQVFVNDKGAMSASDDAALRELAARREMLLQGRLDILSAAEHSRQTRR
jgi:hypothetical protein